MDEIRATFFEECAELLEQLEAGLLRLEGGDRSPETIDAVFRAVHSIKGGAGAFDLAPLVSFAHEFETALDGVRSGMIAIEPAAIVALLRATDRLGDLVAAAMDGGLAAAEIPADLAAMALRANGAASPAMSAANLGAEDGTEFTPLPLTIDLDAANAAGDPHGVSRPQGGDGSDRRGQGTWTIGFEPLPDLLESGNEPLFLFRALEVFGTVEPVAIESDLPPLAELDPRVPRLRWQIRLSPTAPDLTGTEIESVFAFTEGLCVLSLEFTPNAAIDGPSAATRDGLPSELGAPPGPEEPAARPSAAGPASPPEAFHRAPAATIRVDLDRIDRLVNLVGELVICQSMLAQSVQRDDLGPDPSAELDDLQQLTRDIQDSVMAIRAQPVRSLFQRMTRIVREAAQSTGKEVRLELDGEATEIDKTVVERLAEPLTHMIRNAIDHGIEPPGTRLSEGKPRTGTVRLSARQQSDRVVIEVSDDGRGVDRDRVLARAVERGLVGGDRQLEPAEIDRLLFLPGFSTAEGVSALSGRGVGMDVVQSAIRDLNGTIAIQSEPGRGSTVSISLPLTLAILDGMIVRSARQRMVIPLASIIETQTVDAARIEPISPSRSVVQLQDRFVPLLDLAEGMGFGSRPADAPDGEEDSALLFLQPDDLDAYALRVDAIEAQRQVVIKGLGDSFGRVPCVSAATILGDGQVALIIDPGGLALTSDALRSLGPTEARIA